MRTLSSKTATAIAQPVTAPRYLVELGFSSTLRYSSRETLTWNSLSWVSAGILVDSIAPDSASITLGNSDNSISAIVLGEGVRDKSIKIWALDGASPYAVDDAVLLFDGVMSSVLSVAQRVSIACSARQFASTNSPRHRIAPPVCNHLPPVGTQIGNVILESR